MEQRITGYLSGIKEPLLASEISKHFHLKQSAVNYRLRRLEKIGKIKRVGYKRLKYVTVTFVEIFLELVS